MQNQGITIKSFLNQRRRIVFLVIINLVAILQVGQACSCLTDSLYGDNGGDGYCYNYVWSCDSCNTGCYLRFLYPKEDTCFNWLLTTVDVFDCAPCSSNCQICSDSSTCSDCVLGYAVDPNNACVPCNTIYGTGCTDCSSTSSTVCDQTNGYFVVSTSTSCVHCSSIPNCQSCNPGPICLSCATGFYQNTSLPYQGCAPCSDIQNCDTCTSPNSSYKVCDSCLSGHYHNTWFSDKRCISCSDISHCVSCDHGPKCTLCEPSWYRDFGNFSRSCVPCSFIPNCDACVDGPLCTSCSSGYFLDFFSQNRTCVTCNLFKCLTCTDGPKCTSCEAGFYLDTTLNQCLECVFPCIECNPDGVTCTKCPASLLYSLNTGANTCDLCQHALSDCLTCDQAGTECYKCVSTEFFLESATKHCLACQSPCKDCLSATECLSCVDNTYVHIPSTKECKLCSSFMPRCDTCLKENVCTACTATGGPFYLSYSPNKCLTCQEARPNCITCTATPGVGPACMTCEDKFYLADYGCHPCPASCALCTAKNVCTSCINTTYGLSNQLCPPCSNLMANCLQCSSATTCTYCTNDTIVNASGKCSKCPIDEYPDEPNQVCLPCVAPCYSCLNQDDCLSCRQFYEYLPATKRCVDLCGDSVVITDVCDNSFGVIHDGCTDTCQQEPGYTCVLNPDTVSGQAVKRSVCSYNGKVKIVLKQIVKEPFKNTLTWTYFVMPYLHGLPGTTTRLFTQQELKKVFVLNEVSPAPVASSSSSPQSVKAAVPSLTVESVSVSPTNSEVSLTFSYHHDIRQSDIELLVDFAYLRSLGVPNFATTLDSTQRLNVDSYRPDSMIGKFYTDDQYSLAQTLNKVALLIGILSFVAFVVGVFSKELVGLQMAMLCQFSYLSLFYFDGLLELPLFALQSLKFSTGYNLHWADISYTRLDSNPPQALILEFDTMTLSNNFNLMALLYILPLVLVVPFIPMKAKCIRKLSMVELGSKWVDLMLGETMLFIVLFNLQYLVFGLVEFYQDGRNVKDYSSSMIISFGGLMTVCSIVGLVVKPQIYGIFRKSFQFDKQLTLKVIQSKQMIKLNESKKLIQKLNLFVNQNYFQENYQNIHLLLTFNHYFILSIYFVVSTLILTLIKYSQPFLIAISALVLIELILMRPYSKVSQKLRAIYFYIVLTAISIVRFLNNRILQGQYSLVLSIVIVTLLILALLWTYIVLIHYFWCYFVEQFSDRKKKVEKVFQIETDLIDKIEVADQEEVLMMKLMKKYERAEIQINFNNTRNQLLSGYDSVEANRLLKQMNMNSQINQKKRDKKLLIDPQVLNKMEEQNNYKNLKQQVQKFKNNQKRKDMKKRVTGQSMLKLLNLDNFNKYEEVYLMSDQDKLRQNQHTVIKQQKQQLAQNQDMQKQQQAYRDQSKSINNFSKENQIQKQSQAGKGSFIDQLLQKESENQDQQVQNQELLIEENQFVRYARAKKIITNQGLSINYDLINQNFDKI